MNTKISRKEMLPLIGMTIAAFLVNTSEFMPIGLLTDIATEFQITEARAGFMITIYSWVVMILSLPLMLLACKVKTRRLLFGVMAVFGVCQVGSVLSTGFTMLVFSRVGVACVHSIFWSIASPVAVRLVREEHKAKALSMIVTGTSVAMIVGLPFGRIVGLLVGWRMAFGSIALVTFLLLIFLIFVFPDVQNEETFSIAQLPGLLKNKKLLGVYLFNILMATGYYTAYSYIEPFLKQVSEMKDGLVTFVLLIFGVTGLLGSYLFAKFYENHRKVFATTILTVVSAALFLLYPLSGNHIAVVLLCAVWGIAILAYQACFQAELIGCVSPAASSVAMSIFSAMYNLGIGCGTWLGGTVCTYLSMKYVGYVGGGIVALAVLYCIMIYFKKSE